MIEPVIATPLVGEFTDGNESTPVIIGRDWWVAVIFAVNLIHTGLFAARFPQQRWDPDLVAYLTYFRNWMDGDTSLHSLTYFMHPKVLLVFGLGPLASPTAAFYCTTVVSAALGSLVYVISRDHFGRTTALLISAALLFDPSKAFLTLRSSADVYVAAFLFAAILLAQREQIIGASIAILLATLVKPTTLPCTAVFLASQRSGLRPWIATALPMIAIPISAWGMQALLGSVHGTDRFFEEFTTLRGGQSVGIESLIHFVVWVQLVEYRFGIAAAFGFLGLGIWLVEDRRRLRTPLFLIPLLFLFGYLLLSAVSPFMPFFRFFWLLEIWFLMFICFGVREGLRRITALPRAIRLGITIVVAALMIRGFVTRHVDYQQGIALSLERGMSFAHEATKVLSNQHRPHERVSVPLSLMPFFMWELPAVGRAQGFDTAEQSTLSGGSPPDWIVYVPQLYASEEVKRRLPEFIRAEGYTPRYQANGSALLARPGVGRSEATR